MKQLFGLGLGLVVGSAIGAAAVTALHAQGKSQVYLVAEITVRDAQRYATDYQPKMRASIAKAGGHAVAVGGGGGTPAGAALVALLGDAPQRVGISEWDSMDAVKAWFDSADRKAASEIGDKYASFRFYAVEAAHPSH